MDVYNAGIFGFVRIFEFTHVFDLAAVFALAFFVLRGAMRGITAEIISTFGLLASVFCSLMFADPVSAGVMEYFSTWDPTVTEVACAVVIFMGVSAVFIVIKKIVKVLVRATRLSFVDHALEESVMGAVFGGVRTCVLVLIIYGAMSIFSPVLLSEWTKDSAAMKRASEVWPVVVEIVTDKGWINPEQLAPHGIRKLPGYMNDI